MEDVQQVCESSAYTLINLASLSYRCEGNAHVIFGYADNRHIVRIKKNQDDTMSQEAAIRQIMESWLSVRYVPRIRLAILQNSSQETVVLMEEDLTYIKGEIAVKHSGLSPKVERLTVEIKVKCDLKSRSPFLSPTSLVKKRYGRFQIMQIAKVIDKSLNMIEPRWGEFESMSIYSPNDIQSRDYEKVKIAIRALLSTPQNNFRVFADGNQVFSCDAGFDMARLQLVVANFLEFQSLNISPLDMVVDALALICCKEDLFSRLQLLQAMDLLDVEGAAAIYRRLVTLTTNVQDEVIDDLASNVHKLQILAEQITTLLKNAQSSDIIEVLRLASESGDLDDEKHSRLLQCLSEVVGLLSQDDTDEAAKKWVDALCIEDCVIMLQLWLVTLAARDASVLITLQHCDVVTLQKDSTVLGWRYIRDQGTDSAGLIGGTFPSSSPDKNFNFLHLAYSMGAVDIGCKPARKITLKNRQEVELCKKLLIYESYSSS